MERFETDEDEAFEVLITSSQGTNLELVAVARWLAGEANASTPPLDDEGSPATC